MSDIDQQLSELYQRADQLGQAGSYDKLATVFDKILELDPEEPQAHRFLAQWHFGQKNFDVSAKHFKSFNDLVPNQEDMLLAGAVAMEEAGDFEGALKALRRTIKLNENNLYPYIYLGAVYEKMGDVEKANWAYSFGVDLNPSVKSQDRNKVLPQIVVERIKRMNASLEKVSKALTKKAISEAKKKFPKGDFSRMEKSLWRKLHGPKIGLTKLDQRPQEFYVPDLDRGPWFEGDEFDWVKDLEAQFGLIRKELLANFKGDGDLKPYLQSGGYDPRSWGDLVGNKSWGALHFFDGMKRFEDVFRKYPVTGKILDGLPLYSIKGKPVEALFSVLKPKTEIPSHFGNSNTRLTVHLPLVVPAGCALTAGEEERPVFEGKTMIFDDSFTHKAKNTSDQVRIVLIFEVWHPDLKVEERAVVENSYILYEEWMKNRNYDALIDV